MSSAQLQRVPCYGQIAEPVTATGEVIESPEDFDTMLQGNKFGKKDMLQKMCEMHHIATRQGRTEIGKKEMKKRLKKHFIDRHWGMEIPNEPPQIINEAPESDDEL